MDASGKFAGTATVRKMRSSMAPPRRQRGRTVRGKQGLGAGPAATGAGGGAGADGEKETDKHAMCVEILTAGFVQSYVDFFYLTHRPDPNPGTMCHRRCCCCTAMKHAASTSHCYVSLLLVVVVVVQIQLRIQMQTRRSRLELMT